MKDIRQEKKYHLESEESETDERYHIENQGSLKWNDSQHNRENDDLVDTYIEQEKNGVKNNE